MDGKSWLDLPAFRAPKVAGGRSLQIKYEPLCQAATDMSWLIVAVTAMFCAVYVGRAFGGA